LFVVEVGLCARGAAPRGEQAGEPAPGEPAAMDRPSLRRRDEFRLPLPCELAVDLGVHVHVLDGTAPRGDRASGRVPIFSRGAA
jgi:hypothetical protein